VGIVLRSVGFDKRSLRIKRNGYGQKMIRGALALKGTQKGGEAIRRGGTIQ